MFPVIFIISLLVYGILVFYVGWSIYKGFNLHRIKWLKYFYILLIAFISLSFIVGRYGNGIRIIQAIGNYWLALFCIMLLTLPFVHLTLLLLRFTKVNRNKSKQWATIFTSIIVVTGLLFGIYQAYSTKITTYNITINKSGPEQIKAVLLTDTHFGYLSGLGHAKRMVEKVNVMNADYIFISGDLIDDDLSIVKNKGIFDVISQLKSKFGTYTVLGNHDKDEAGTKEIIKAFEDANMKVIYEDALLLNDQLYVVGRKDLSEGERLTAEQLLSKLDHTKPIFVLDHQPSDLIALSESGADLTLSGHTHRGQIFPGNLLTQCLFPNDYGLKRFNQMMSIVSSGYGFWGPPIRIGSQSEIVEINISFNP